MSTENEAVDVRCNLLVIRSRQIDQAASFYEALGLHFTKHRHGSGPEHYASETVGHTFEIYPLADNGTPTTETRIGFAVARVDDVFARLVEAGGKSISPPKPSPWGRRAVVCDLDGHRVELTATTLGESER
ncbi:Glyoxalase-like domain protein [Rosistilla ulvae]|uniref:Glyoxalase-like domain protein n=1 Tax=Rosistilla ulvae TaxID=1930277 RepID=A0A517LUK7_9BACT|nr:VOC family protein [Rosistilla ulvae]QDS86289.1 Glyoxalase-like domain protein [Rosistilla ulvae]